MERKDLLELKKRFKKEENTFTKVCGCYVNSDKEPVLKFRETFHSLPDDEMFKYLEIAKKTLSGKIGNNMLELTFPLDDKFENEKQQLLMMIKKSGLNQDGLLDILYESIIDNYEDSGNYLILLYHDIYDVMVKTSDNRKLDESEEVYEYIICAICPVKLSKPGLGYFNKENQIKSRIRDWVVDVPAAGFTFPGFIDRSSDVGTVMYYTKNVKEPQIDFMENGLGCFSKQTATNQLNTFEAIVKETVSDKEVSEKVFIDIQENLNTMIEEHKEIYEDTDHEPITLTKEKVKDILVESGLSEDISLRIEESYEEKFGEEPPLAENLVDAKLLKKNEQKKTEERLLNQIEELEAKLEQVEAPNSDDQEVEANDEEELEETQEETKDYDVVLHVKPEKLDAIKTEIINGQRCILVPIDDDEQMTINGLDNLL
ncbi:DUF4317 domain-containing protein [Acidaminobacter sp. JC074]|uniref:DUF4317 domain-containing protein n=1 Tax=Acidaminobacter sp. JC074 TaxID=2530199 RepID=UPI001F0FF36C|nr:DUF4317 domain-containing protein [Acidaminobacter sp. JC074]MCH4887884.1 DUF4317 domain-containing protein [Acidaminobacter sp. JC074]